MNVLGYTLLAQEATREQAAEAAARAAAQTEAREKAAAESQARSDEESARAADLDARRRKAEEIGFTAYGLTKDLDDPLAKAVHALLDHAVESDRRFAELVRRLEAAGIALPDLPGEDQGFDPQRVSRWVE